MQKIRDIIFVIAIASAVIVQPGTVFGSESAPVTELSPVYISRGDLFADLARASENSNDFAKAGTLFVAAGHFYKSAAKDLDKESAKARKRGDLTGEKQLLVAAGQEYQRAADAMLDAAKNFERAGDLDATSTTYAKAFSCFRLAMQEFQLAGDIPLVHLAQREMRNVRAQLDAVLVQIRDQQ